MARHANDARLRGLLRSAAGRAPPAGGRRQWLLQTLAAGVAWEAAPLQALRVRALRLIVVYPPGGASDAFVRVLAPALEAVLGHPVWIDHRGGAGGAIGLRLLAHAAADGHTVALSAITPFTLRRLRSDALPPLGGPDGLVPIGAALHTPSLLVATPALHAADFAAMLQQARRRSRPLRWATSGHGTTGHLILEQVQRQSGSRFTHIPYQGGGTQLNDALGSHFELLSTNVALQQMAHVRQGRLRALAVGFGQRVAALPAVPTLAELGFASANLASVFGLFAPPRTPAATVLRLNQALRAALQAPAVRQHIDASHQQAGDGSAQAFAHAIEQERRRNSDLPLQPR
ncbi:tripartite tricarboxylate transporter substrate binding protein [Comamonas serinivorans]|nr:tripartite tricarboxylate transporter substrate binding protein [Comamonas serinivorans]